MCITQCLLALVALYVGLAHSWDIAVGVGDQLIFYTDDGTKTNTVNLISRNLTALAYDEVQNTMLYVDKESNNDAICGVNLHSEENRCFIERNGRNIHSIAFDPATQILFFTDTNDNSINWISLKPGSVNNVHGNLLIKMDDRTPSDIAVESCTGYIYWINTDHKNYDYNSSIERARFNGSNRETLKKTYKQYDVMSLVIDPLTGKICYFDGNRKENSFRYEYLNHADLDGQNELIKHSNEDGHFSAVKELTVSKDYFYWVNRSESHTTVWQKAKNAIEDKQPENITTFDTEKQLAIATNYKIEDQIQGLQDCPALSSLIPTITVTNNSLIIEQTTEHTTDVELFCVHGVHVSETSVCKCTPGYIGERCEVSVCQNYCLQGNCTLNDGGLPTCSCNADYTGERCEVSVCGGYCLNNGTCSLKGNSEPVCECKGDYVGDRCEVSHCLNYCIQGNCSVDDDGLPTCRCNTGYSGDRCEVYACGGYCLNDGACSLNEEDDPVCQCAGTHVGSRCETVKDVTFTINNAPSYYSAERNLTLADLLANGRKPSARVTITVEV